MNDVAAIADMSRAYGLLRGCIEGLRMTAVDDGTRAAKQVDSTVETADSLWNSALERMAAPLTRGAVRDA